MSVIFKELVSLDEFKQVITLQEETLGLKDVEKVGIAFLKMLSRQNPRTGFVLGAIDNDQNSSNLIAYSIFIINGSQAKSVYNVMLGVSPSYQKTGISLDFFLYIRQTLLQNGFNLFVCAIEPMNRNLLNLYFHKLNFKGFNYEISELKEETGLPIDRLLIKWELDSEETILKLTDEYKKKKYKDFVQEAEEVKVGDTPTHQKILIEIHKNFPNLKQIDSGEAMRWRLLTRELFDLYINKRAYIITSFCSIPDKAFYVLEKQ